MVSSKSSPSRSVVGLASPNRSRIAHLVEFVAAVFTLSSVLGFAPARDRVSSLRQRVHPRRDTSSPNTASLSRSRLNALSAEPDTRSSLSSTLGPSPRSSPQFFLGRNACDRNSLAGTSKSTGTHCDLMRYTSPQARPHFPMNGKVKNRLEQRE